MSQPFDNRDWDLRQIAEKEAEIERLKFLNKEERETIEELSRLCRCAADALETYPVGSGWNLLLIDELRKAAGE